MNLSHPYFSPSLFRFLCRSRILLIRKTRICRAILGRKRLFRFTRFQTKLLSPRQRYSISEQQQHTIAHRRHACMENSLHFRDNTIVTTLIYIPAANTESRLQFRLPGRAFSASGVRLFGTAIVRDGIIYQNCVTQFSIAPMKRKIKKKKCQRIASIYLEL